jgi:O-antigen/teichoic acid export membrane protein
LSIKVKLFKGAIWNGISQFGSQGINFVITIILARLLSPYEFGLVGMVGVFTAFIGYFTEFGLKASLVQKKDLDEIDCQTVFWTTLFFSIFFYILVYLLAPLIAKFYKIDELVLITRIIFIQFLIYPFAFVNEASEIKELKYKNIAIADIVGLFLSGLVGISLAFMGFGVWSLVALQICKVFIRTICIIYSTSFKPKFIYSLNRFVKLMGSGFQFTLNNLLQFSSENIDYLLIGKLLGANALGVYTLAFRIANYPFKKLKIIFGSMLFPAFVTFNDDPLRVKCNYFKISILGGLVVFPILFVIMICTETFVIIALGNQWLSTVPIIKILVLYLFILSFSFGDDPIMMAIGKVKAINIIRLITISLLGTIGFMMTLRFGMKGMAITLTCTFILNNAIIKYILIDSMDIKFKDYWGNMKILIRFVLYLLAGTLGFELLISKIHISHYGRTCIYLFIVLTITMVFYIKNNILNLKERKINFNHLVTIY